MFHHHASTHQHMYTLTLTHPYSLMLTHAQLNDKVLLQSLAQEGANAYIHIVAGFKGIYIGNPIIVIKDRESQYIAK